MDLSNKVALITGGAQGIGKEVALTLAKANATVVVNYIDFNNNKEIALQTKKEIEDLGVKCMIIAADVSNYDEVKEMMDTVVKELGSIDILINNAGITKDNLIMRMKEADFDAVVNVNLKGTFNCMKHVTKIMMKQRSGRIISMSSVVGVMGNAGQVNYAATKSGVIGMTMSLAREVGSRGITVNAVAPGFIKTAMTDVLPDEAKEKLKSQIPLGYLGEVKDIANTVLFLASDEARYITGQTIHVDGGMAM
ncbi:MAG: 3-oxoacyl-[acyl-carrier-protein] reductase [Thomasclavelia sp.]|jgi:3-oxoacyl-[acyl-carrier protein] reductase|nr:3-oxoacyl-[acyl-carrier-protein] reductase [Thomasclavelia sp.]